MTKSFKKETNIMVLRTELSGLLEREKEMHEFYADLTSRMTDVKTRRVIESIKSQEFTHIELAQSLVKMFAKEE